MVKTFYYVLIVRTFLKCIHLIREVVYIISIFFIMCMTIHITNKHLQFIRCTVSSGGRER